MGLALVAAGAYGCREDIYSTTTTADETKQGLTCHLVYIVRLYRTIEKGSRKTKSVFDRTLLCPKYPIDECHFFVCYLIISSISASEMPAKQSARRAPRSRTAPPRQRAAEVVSLLAGFHWRERWMGRLASSPLKPRKRLMPS